MPPLAGTSYWLDSAPESAYPELAGDVTVDVAVIGAGIAGVSAALMLKRDGARVAVIEADRVAAGASGYSTAKVTSLHGLIYHSIESSFGEEGARAYGEANQAGLEKIASLVEELAIDCDWRRKPAYTYAPSDKDLAKLEKEVEAAERAGLPASFVSKLPELPFEAAGAICFEKQAEFNPVKYLQALAAEVDGDGSAVYERTRVTGVSDDSPCTVRTENGARVIADHVVVATHMPILDRGFYFARQHPERSYVVAVRLAGTPPQGMYLSTESPSHSLRSQPYEGGELFLVGGESHKTGQSNEAERYAALEEWGREQFDVVDVEYRWATQDNMPVDGVPFVGKLHPFTSRLWTATGFHKWGYTNGAAAALMLADAIAGRENPWLDTFSSTRLKPVASAKEFVLENANVGRRLVVGWLSPGDTSADELAPGEAGLIGLGPKVAAYRDDDGVLHTRSATCTHMGCQVAWNPAERTWDCPCHGSRFRPEDGEVIQGPAVRPLGEVELD